MCSTLCHTDSKGSPFSVGLENRRASSKAFQILGKKGTLVWPAESLEVPSGASKVGILSPGMDRESRQPKGNFVDTSMML